MHLWKLYLNQVNEKKRDNDLENKGLREPFSKMMATLNIEEEMWWETGDGLEWRMRERGCQG